MWKCCVTHVWKWPYTFLINYPCFFFGIIKCNVIAFLRETFTLQSLYAMWKKPKNQAIIENKVNIRLITSLATLVAMGN